MKKKKKSRKEEQEEEKEVEGLGQAVALGCRAVLGGGGGQRRKGAGVKEKKGVVRGLVRARAT